MLDLIDTLYTLTEIKYSVKSFKVVLRILSKKKTYILRKKKLSGILIMTVIYLITGIE